MLVICEDCAKKYNIDESKIKGNRARFTCNECGHIIIVNKSDLSRPLVHSSSQEKAASSSIDLLKEMEAPLSPESETSQTNSVEQPEQDEKGSIPASSGSEKKRIVWTSLSIPAYILIGALFSFILTNIAVLYILSQYSWVIAQHMQEFQKDLLITSLLVMLVSWAISIIILFAIGNYMSKSLLKINKTLNLISLGDTEAKVTVLKHGPEEVVTLSHLLSELCKKVR